MLIDAFITKIRQRTGANRYSIDASGNPTEGIPQNAVVDFINEAKDYVQAGIISAGSHIADVYETINIVSGTSEYTLTDNIHFGNKIRNVQYSVDGTDRNYRDLRQLRDEERLAYDSSTPWGYIRRARVVELVPKPNRTGGSIKVRFPRQWDDITLRVGQITSKTTTSLTLDNDSYLNSVDLASAAYVCTVTVGGVVKDYSIAVTAYDSGTRVISFATRTLTCSAGDFVVIGKYASSHTDHLPNPLIEQYIKIESQMRIFDMKTSIDAIREDKQLTKRYNAIIEGYEDELLDETDIPVSDPTLY